MATGNLQFLMQRWRYPEGLVGWIFVEFTCSVTAWIVGAARAPASVRATLDSVMKSSGATVMRDDVLSALNAVAPLSVHSASSCIRALT